MRRLRVVCAVCAMVFGVGARGDAQEARPGAPAPAAPAPPAASGPATLKVGSLDISVIWRSRLEMWDWFEGPVGNNDYAFFHSLVRVGIGQSRPGVTWFAEVSQPTLLALPDDAVAPAPLGQLGLGGTYYVANDQKTNTAGFFLKQGFVQFNRIGRSTLKLGRFEFFDGTEAPVPDPVVAKLVQGRIAHRLISNFGFTVAQRSFDGGLWRWTAGPNTVSGFAARPTAGVFQVGGMKELDIEVYYGSYNRAVKRAHGAGSFRVFGVGYADHRTSVLKTDNRPLAVRQADHEPIALGTVGADYVHVFDTSAGKVDVLGWVVGQFGSWGTLSQRASAFVGEAGWQPHARLKPWIRGGYSYGSGDDDPKDGTNGTFFQLVTTPRQYARFPFYNMMNNKDLYGLVTVRPGPKVTLGSEVHRLWLASGSDLWYGGGGPFQPDTFGFAGRPSYGKTSLASVWDLSADTALTPHLALGLYYGHAFGSDVITGTFPEGPGGNFGYVETVVRF